MKVSVSGKQFIFPRSCACCGAYPLTTIVVSGTEKNKRARTKGWTWQIPYCVACKQHVKSFDHLLMGTLIAVALFSLISATVGVAYREWQLGVLVAILLVVGLLATFKVVVKLIKAKCPINCHMLARAVEYLGSDGPCHTFEIRSPWYASEFVRANHRKIVNANSAVAAVLQGTSFGRHQMPWRITKR